MLVALAVSAWLAPPGFGSSELETALAGLEVDCSTLKSWGRGPEGEPWLRFDVSCQLPERARALVEGRDPAGLMSSLADPDARYAAAAAIAALGNIRELPAPERMRLALELARRETEPFASATLGFFFGDTRWWDLPERPNRLLRPLGYLAAPWDRSMTPVVREYLWTGLEDRPVSTLAVYVCTLMTEQLDPEILLDLERVIRAVEPGSLEAKLAREAVDKLRERTFGS